MRALFFALLLMSNAPRSAAFYPIRLSVSGSYVFPKYETQIINGSFSLTHIAMRPCVEIGTDIPLFPSGFRFGFGIRYHHYATTISANNTAWNLYNNPHPFIWERGYTAFTIPLSISNSFLKTGKPIAELRASVAFGLLSTGSAINRAMIDRTTAPNYLDTVDAIIIIPSENNPTFFFATADIAATVYPFPRRPQLGITAQVSFELTNNNRVSHEARIDNINTNETYRYDITNTTRFRTVSLGVRYNFGGSRKSKGNEYDCPK